MKKFLVAGLLVLFFSGALHAEGQQEGGSLGWTLGLRNTKTGELLPFSAPIRSWNGESFMLVINPESACFAYVVVESPDEALTVVYSGPLEAGEDWLSPVMELTDPKGSESFFIVVSGSEQKVLAQRIAGLEGSGGAQKRALLNEIFRLRAEVSRFQEAPEKPVLMGGASRGPPEKNQGVEYSGLNTYVKTISIEH